MREADGKMGGKTDWTAYYGKKRSWISAYTQQFTLEEILGVMERYFGRDKKQGLKVLELGGGGSCFAKQICSKRKINTYDIVDNNELAVSLFNKMEIRAGFHAGIQRDLLDDSKKTDFSGAYDFVYSVGLAEHFRGRDIETVIHRHYEYCKDGGVVMVTFPTPTKKYTVVRRCMEAMGVWQFYDEQPIRYEEVESFFRANGTVEKQFINKKLPLTQMIVVARKGAYECSTYSKKIAGKD